MVLMGGHDGDTQCIDMTVVLTERNMIGVFKGDMIIILNRET